MSKGVRTGLVEPSSAVNWEEEEEEEAPDGCGGIALWHCTLRMSLHAP